MGNIFIGTSGYTYTDWKDSFYSHGLPQKQYLSYYAKHFTTVEINATFYRYFPKYVYERWAEETTDTFVFAIKGPRVITHRKRLRDTQEMLARFLISVAGLGQKLAVILWQFPTTFHCTNETIQQLHAFLPLLPQDSRQGLSTMTPAHFRQRKK